MGKHALFIFQMIALGLAIALVAVFMRPELVGSRHVVEVKSSETPKIYGGRVSYAGAVSNAAPAVVNITTSKVVIRESQPRNWSEYFQRQRGVAGRPELDQEQSLGSGVIIDSKGYILTSSHVIAGADDIRVKLSDGSVFDAKALGADPDTDIAVLKIESTALTSIVTGDSSDLEVGDVVLAIGNPFNIGQTVTQGIISATGRNQLGLNTYEDFIQTDAAINPGNSGGALINAFGQLVGINTAIYGVDSSLGIGFAIPVNLAKDVMTQIIENGQVIRGWLGVRVDGPTVMNAQGQSIGVRLSTVNEAGPAFAAGMRVDDVITDIQDVKMKDVLTALNLIATTAPNTELTVKGIRNIGQADQQTFETKIMVGVRPLQLNAPA